MMIVGVLHAEEIVAPQWTHRRQAPGKKKKRPCESGDRVEGAATSQEHLALPEASRDRKHPP